MNEEYREWLTEKILTYLPTKYSRVGNEIRMRCPICGDSKTNKLKMRGYLSLYPNVLYYCHNCNTSMSGVKFLSVISGTDQDKVKEEFFKFKYNGKNFNLTSNSLDVNKSTTTNKAYNYIFNPKSIIKPDWKKQLSDKAKEYLSNRMVDKSPFLKDNLYSFYDKAQREFIMIPWVLNGTEVYFQLNDFQHFTNNMKYIFPKHMEKVIYGLDNVDINFPYIICFEGVYDSLFVKNGVAIGGKYLTELQKNIIKQRFPNHQIVLSFDNDKSGIDSIAKLFEDKKADNYSYFVWFNKNTKQKDINDYVLYKNNPMIFSDENIINKFIMNPIKMKLFLRSFEKNDIGEKTSRKVQFGKNRKVFCSK